MEPARLPLDASAPSPEPPKPRPISAPLWSALARVRTDIRIEGRLRDAFISPTRICEGCCIEVKARFVRVDGLFDESIWFLTAEDVREICALLGATAEAAELLRDAQAARS